MTCVSVFEIFCIIFGSRQEQEDVAGLSLQSFLFLVAGAALQSFKRSAAVDNESVIILKKRMQLTETASRLAVFYDA